ncbi:MAG: SH3 domain-containing protein [Candidatus Omnitrophica bacterium]|nr:SH3 domain-containing protein [Candidatus Omnitrophota bacterium]
MMNLNVCCTFVSAASVQEFFPFLGEVTSEKVNIRAGQSVNFENLCFVNNGDKLVVLERDYSWYKVMLPEKADNFISSKYVELIESDFGEIVGDHVNIRSKSNTSSSIVGQLVRGDKVVILSEEEGFYKIYPHKNSFGWIADEYIKFTSKDISKYKRTLSDEKERELLLKRQEEERIAEELKSIVTIAGVIQVQEDIELDGLIFKIVADDSSVYYIKGFNDVLGGFVNKKVKVEGKVDQNSRQIVSFPIVNALKFQLEL